MEISRKRARSDGNTSEDQQASDAGGSNNHFAISQVDPFHDPSDGLLPSNTNISSSNVNVSDILASMSQDHPKPMLGSGHGSGQQIAPQAHTSPSGLGDVLSADGMGQPTSGRSEVEQSVFYGSSAAMSFVRRILSAMPDRPSNATQITIAQAQPIPSNARIGVVNDSFVLPTRSRSDEMLRSYFEFSGSAAYALQVIE